jgi:hypothetical protein
MKKWVPWLLGFCIAVAAAADVTAPTEREVGHLLDYLEHSNCRFFRNGSWYSAGEAKTHLKKKYDYLVEKNMVRKAEDFIEGAATRSSISGQPYQVECAARTIPSARWLTEELARYRGSQDGKK